MAKTYKPWQESYYPVSAIAEQFDIKPRLVVEHYWSICQVREGWRPGDTIELKALETRIRNIFMRRTKSDVARVEWRNYQDALVQTANAWRPVKL